MGGIGTCATDWAFAFWGGQAWIFLQTRADTSTGVWQFDPVSQNLTEPVVDAKRTIVGAGISICAPTQH